MHGIQVKLPAYLSVRGRTKRPVYPCYAMPRYAPAMIVAFSRV